MRLPENPRKTKIPQYLKKQILKGVNCCPICKRERSILIEEARVNNFPVSKGSGGLTIDHKVPRSKGGTNDPVNLQPMCYPCNLRKKDE